AAWTILRSVIASSPRPEISASRAGGAEITSANEPNFSSSFLGDRLDVAARQRPEQHELQKLVFGKTLRTGLSEPRAQPLAMAMVMRRRLRDCGQRGTFLKVRFPPHRRLRALAPEKHAGIVEFCKP